MEDRTIKGDYEWNLKSFPLLLYKFSQMNMFHNGKTAKFQLHFQDIHYPVSTPHQVL